MDHDSAPDGESNDLQDAIMAGPTTASAEDLDPIPSSGSKYCFLCKYGGCEGTIHNVNVHSKKLNAALVQLRASLGVYKTAQYLKDVYDESIATEEPFDEEEEWELDTVVEHLCSHAAPESVSRGENPADVAYEVFSKLLLFQSKHMIERETGLIEAQALKSLCAISDRMYKFMPKKGPRASGSAGAGNKKTDDDFF